MRAGSLARGIINWQEKEKEEKMFRVRIFALQGSLGSNSRDRRAVAAVITKTSITRRIRGKCTTWDGIGTLSQQ